MIEPGDVTVTGLLPALTSSAWIHRPTGRHAHQPTKSVRGVYGTPLNGIWSNVGLQVRDLVRGLKTRYSIDPARFVTHGEDGKETLGPVVIWVGAYPGSTSADTAHEVSQDILKLLEKNGVKDVEVEWHEAVSWKAACPALLRVVGNNNPIVHRGRMPRVASGSSSTKIATSTATTAPRFLREKIEGTYEFKGAGAPRQYVRLNGLRRFQRGLDEIKVAVSDHRMLADLYAREIIRLEAKGTSEDEEEAEEDAKELLKTRQNLDEQKQAIAGLEKFYEDVKAQWSDIELRNIGHVHYSPPIYADVEGTAIAPEKLTVMMYPQSDGRKTFKYPENRQLKINGIVMRELLANPDLFDSEGQPYLIVLKDGCTTDLTIGRYAGLESFLCDEDGVESIELAIYNYVKMVGPFSAKRDSGSLIFDGLGRMVGLLHSGKSKGGSTSAHVTRGIRTPTSIAPPGGKGENNIVGILLSHFHTPPSAARFLALGYLLVGFFGADRCFDRWAAIKMNASGLWIDLIGGDEPIATAVEKVLKEKVTARDF
ncbi:hypothetical protein D9758_002097 [Tetrapyrgos nigripes]|uniref:Uncharacterized protein n=1 Tax=Tetrapyrgos nigripes TaxID=182062 RepID=A0A8H5GTJ0_9AGAR|nr:hypothetical protein D9758_002097 [Tetrapyrgos nigripes]